MLIESDLRNIHIIYTCFGCGYRASTIRPEQFNISPFLPVLIVRCSRYWFIKYSTYNALLSPRLHLVQAKYIFRGVITKMRGSEAGYDVNQHQLNFWFSLFERFSQDKRNQSF